MTLIELEEKLKNVFPAGCSIDVDNEGQIIIYTGLMEDRAGAEGSDNDSELIVFVPKD